MSKYTTEVRFICENASGLDESAGYNDVNTILDECWQKIFSFEFPIFDESYRAVLCKKILKHFYTREICEETVGLWKLRLDTKLNEIMPYYNQLYNSELIKFNPMYDTDLTTNNDGFSKTKGERAENVVSGRNGTSKNDKTTTDNSTLDRVGSGNSSEDSTENTVGSGTTKNEDVRRDLYSDTPQGALDGVEAQNYLTNARKITDDRNETRNYKEDKTGHREGTYADTGKDTYGGTVVEDGSGNFTEAGTRDTTGNNTIDTTDGYVQKVLGKTAGTSYSKLLQEFRDTFLNIDMKIINDLNPLFFGLW